ncbi:MAG TPA: CDP-glucose 4,6-dehydratase [Terracidiphilus sp.]|jgi:CDP-glucose 4,6-dehydratase|nr:CDP-glucose 4,6-dehydratase [Terracidiphilus sp.]
MNWGDKRVLITGHTGFKGGWLSLALASRGARITGVALEPETTPNFFTAAGVASAVDSRIGDVRDLDRLLQVFEEAQPEIVFHLAAQPLVRRSYAQPLETFAVNVMGTAHVLEAVRRVGSASVVVVITTDKCYENREWHWGYRENDPLGGHDPYSASKAASEMVAAAYRSSFFAPGSRGGQDILLATARAGNVIGGGDWSEDRLIPDMVRAFSKGTPVMIRNPHAVRPWQHVLEPVEAYVHLAETLWARQSEHASAWNFGPELTDAIPVGEVVRGFAELWGEGATWEIDGLHHVHEAGLLRLDCSKAAMELGWFPRLRIHDALRLTAEWYRQFLGGSDMSKYSMDQIAQYQNLSAPVCRAMPTR